MQRQYVAVFAALLAALPLLTVVSRAQDFESLVEDALKRQQQGGEPAPGEDAFPPLPPGVYQPPDGSAPQYGTQQPAQPEFGAPPQYGTQPQYDAQQPYGTQPQNGAQPEFGAQPQDGTIRQYGTVPPELLRDPGPPKPYTPPVIPEAERPKPPVASAQQAGGTAPQAAPATAEAAPATATGEAAPATGEAASDTAATQTFEPGAELTREDLTVDAVNQVTFTIDALSFRGATPIILKTQVLLDRAGASPGAIDAYSGGNFHNAIAAVQTVLRQDANGKLSKEAWDALKGDATQDVLGQYTITAEDAAYPFTPNIPPDFSQQALMTRLNYRNAQEMLAERFHMDEKLLMALNPDADFSQAGTTIWVTEVKAQPVAGTIARIVVSRSRKQVLAYDAEGRLIVAYPATIGSEENPMPSGDHQIVSVTREPQYSYASLTLPPGPNNPVGTVWIDLSDPGYGIHGTPEPTKVGRPATTGCVRLTNWDAEELAGLVQPGVAVSFVE